MSKRTNKCCKYAHQVNSGNYKCCKLLIKSFDMVVTKYCNNFQKIRSANNAQTTNSESDSIPLQVVTSAIFSSLTSILLFRIN